MIIDLILDRRDDKKYGIGYDAKRFYDLVMNYIDFPDDYASKITYAMDYLEEEYVKKALCDYVINNEYNPKICEYINSVEWLVTEEIFKPYYTVIRYPKGQIVKNFLTKEEAVKELRRLEKIHTNYTESYVYDWN